MRNKLRFWTGVTIGAALQYFFDPKAGEARRADLRHRMAARMRDAADEMAVNLRSVGTIDHLHHWRVDPRRVASRMV